MQQPILNHIKTVQTQNNELFTNFNRLEAMINEMKEEMNNKAPNNNNTNFITMQDLELVIDDVKSSLDYVINQTPRNNDEINLLKCKLDTLNERLNNLEQPQIYDDEPRNNNTRSIPKLNLIIKKKKT